MRQGFCPLLISAMTLAGLYQVALAQIASPPRPTCPPGCRVIEETVLKEHVRHCCKVVPEVKKKWVYDWVDDPFCLPKSPLCRHGKECEKGSNCQGPYGRKQLVKKQVETCIGHKCVVEKIVEVVPCTVYRIVPCGKPGALEKR